MSKDNMATGHNLDTSEGARAYVAEFFANQVRRHDFRAYITTRLAADFACALAQHLAAQPSPASQGEPNTAPNRLTDLAQAADPTVCEDAARWRAIAPHLQVEWDEDEFLKRWTWIDFKRDALSVPTRSRESYASLNDAMDAVIDSQAVRNG